MQNQRQLITALAGLMDHSIKDTDSLLFPQLRTDPHCACPAFEPSRKRLLIIMVDPFSVTGLVLAVVSVIQGARKIFSSLWRRLKAAFGGTRSQSKYRRAGPDDPRND